MLKCYYHKNNIEAGVDEAGRGCYAGPVVAAAVILPKNFKHALLNDSKQVKEKDRELLRTIIEKESITYSVAFVNNVQIDELNILQATYNAMHAAIANLKTAPNYLLIDGNRFKPYKKIEHTCIIKGDGKYTSIAAASILAKTYRDEYMKKISAEFPHYNWHQNKGYGTLAHRNAIQQFGLCKYHRKTFNILPSQISLF